MGKIGKGALLSGEAKRSIIIGEVVVVLGRWPRRERTGRHRLFVLLDGENSIRSI